jgi:hypothetical protein
LKTTTPLTQKTCKRCKVEKPVLDFAKGRSYGSHAWCKPCMAEYQLTYKQKKGKEYFKNYNFMSKYGITLEEAQKMLADQHNSCALCKKEVQFLPGFSNAAHIDHCHSSGKVRGILCGNCNTALGKLGDSVETIKNVLKYLEQGK